MKRLTEYTQKHKLLFICLNMLEQLLTIPENLERNENEILHLEKIVTRLTQ